MSNYQLQPLFCSLGFVVFSEEIDGLNVIARSLEGEIGVLVDPVTKVEEAIGICDPCEVWGSIPVVALWDGSAKASFCDISQANATNDAKEVVADGNSWHEIVLEVVQLNTTKSKIVTSIDNSSHLLSLRESDGMGPWGRGRNGVVCEGNGGKLQIQNIDSIEVHLKDEIQPRVETSCCSGGNGIGFSVEGVTSTGAISSIELIW